MKIKNKKYYLLMNFHGHKNIVAIFLWLYIKQHPIKCKENKM